MTWGGGILGGVGGRRMSQWCGLPAHHQQDLHCRGGPHQCLFTQVGQLTINKIFFDKADYINAFSHSMLQREEVFLILTMSSRPAPCGSPAVTIASAMRGGSASPGVQTLVTRPWRSFITRHGGARGRQRRGNPPFGREEKTTKRAEPNFAPPQLVVFNGRK